MSGHQHRTPAPTSRSHRPRTSEGETTETAVFYFCLQG